MKWNKIWPSTCLFHLVSMWNIICLTVDYKIAPWNPNLSTLIQFSLCLFKVHRVLLQILISSIQFVIGSSQCLSSRKINSNEHLQCQYSRNIHNLTKISFTTTWKIPKNLESYLIELFHSKYQNVIWSKYRNWTIHLLLPE